jgi:hypothetical protein
MANDERDDIKKLIESLDVNVGAIVTLMRDIKEQLEDIADELRR